MIQHKIILIYNITYVKSAQWFGKHSIRDNRLAAENKKSKVLILYLETPELTLFAPVVEGCDEDNNDDGEENGQTLDPVRVVLLLF